jgi:hypothetical protein
VFDPDDGDAALRPDSAHRLGEIVDLGGREPAADLVEQQDVRVGGQRPGEPDPLAGRDRQVAGVTAGVGGEVDEIERRVDGASRGVTVAAPSAEHRAREHVLAHGRLVEGPNRLERSGDPGTTHRVRTGAGELRLAENDGPRVWGFDAGDGVEKRRLAGPVRTDDAHDLPGVDGEADVVDGGQPAVGLRDPLDFEHAITAAAVGKSLSLLAVFGHE